MIGHFAKKTLKSLNLTAEFSSRRISSFIIPKSAVMRPFCLDRKASASLFGKMLSTTSVRAKSLEQALKSELEYERDNSNNESPSFVSNFEQSSGFKVIDTPGNKEVILTRTLNGEKIDVYVNILAIEGEEVAEAAEEAQEEVEDDADGELSIPAVITVQKVDKPEMGGLQFEVSIENGAIFIDNVLYFKDSSLVNADSSEADWARESLYGGPVFSELDENVQDLFHQYLEDRGCEGNISQFLQLYLDHKEQNEYMHWLEDVQKFIKN